MEFLIENSLLTFREKMGIRENDDFDGQIAKLLRKWEDLEKKLVKQQSFRDVLCEWESIWDGNACTKN